MSDRSSGPQLPLEELISPEELKTGIAAMGAELTGVLQRCAQPPVLVGVLKGCAFFLADLVRSMDLDVNVDFISISAYSASVTGSPSGVVRIVKDLDQSVAGRDVVIVEDIVDTGLTLNYLRRALVERGPKSLRAVTLLDKAARRIVPVPLEHACFEIPDQFVIGYGLDFQSLYRNVPGIVAVTDFPRLVTEPRLLVEGLWPTERKA